MDLNFKRTQTNVKPYFMKTWGIYIFYNLKQNVKHGRKAYCMLLKSTYKYIATEHLTLKQ